MSYQDCQRIERNGGLTHLREQYKLAPAELIVIRALIQADQDGECYPTQESTALESGLPVETVRRAARGLARKGLIIREKDPYIDKRGRMRPGKIYHYRFVEAVIDAIVSGRPLPDTVQNNHYRAPDFPDTVQNDHNRETLPDTVQNDHYQAPDLPDSGQNDHNRAPDLPDTVHFDHNRGILPDSDQNDHHIVIRMNGNSDQNDQYVPIKMNGEKLEVEIENKKEIENDPGRSGERANVNGTSSQGAALDAKGPEPRLSGQDRFRQIARVVSASQYNALVKGIQAIIDREMDRGVKDAIVHRCCDRIEELLLRGEEPAAALAAEEPKATALFGKAAGTLAMAELQRGQLAAD